VKSNPSVAPRPTLETVLRFKEPIRYVGVSPIRALASVILLACRWSLPAPAAPPTSAPTFNRDVAPILYKNCARCHGAGEIASHIPILTYDDAHARAASIRRVVASRFMPPWPVDPARSLKFVNDARLSRKEIDAIVAWADAGAPEGSGLPPKPPDSGWDLFQGRRPDFTVALTGDMHIHTDLGEIVAAAVARGILRASTGGGLAGATAAPDISGAAMPPAGVW